MDKVLKIGIIGCGAIGKDHCRRIICLLYTSDAADE